MPRPIRVLLFSIAREAVGRDRVDREVGADGIALGDLLAGLAREFPKLPRVLRSSRIAVNGEYVSGERVQLAAGDEVAVHPPYSGG